jgi:DNA-binding transcriptional MerR regulator
MQQYEDLLIDALLDQGFTLEEAERLIALHEYVECERQEARQLRALFQKRQDKNKGD